MKKRKFILTLIVIIFLIGFVFAEKLEINTANEYHPGDNTNFKITLYDDQNNKIQGKIDFEIQDYYTEIFKKGTINSGEEINFKLPDNSVRGYWAIIVKYNDLEKKFFFNILELEKADIKLEGDKLIVTNVGNVPYRKSIQIEIGNNKETLLVPLGTGETKEIKLTAPNGNYDIKVSDGTKDNDLVFKGISLTGNVIGLERLSGRKGFFSEYPLISLFLVVIVITLIISGLRFLRKNKE